MNPPLLNGKPTQAPLNREQQKIAFESLKQSYFQEQPPTPSMAIQPIKEYKLTEVEQLKALQLQMKERNMNVENIKEITERIDEKKTQETIKTFYCHHIFQLVKASWGILPVKYKVCSKCGLVK